MRILEGGIVEWCALRWLKRREPSIIEHMRIAKMRPNGRSGGVSGCGAALGEVGREPYLQDHRLPVGVTF